MRQRCYKQKSFIMVIVLYLTKSRFGRSNKKLFNNCIYECLSSMCIQKWFLFHCRSSTGDWSLFVNYNYQTKVKTRLTYLYNCIFGLVLSHSSYLIVTSYFLLTFIYLSISICVKVKTLHSSCLIEWPTQKNKNKI